MRSDLYWIDTPRPGHLAIMPRPRGGDWLEDEVRGWRQAGIDVVVSLLTSEEATELAIVEEAQLCQAAGIEFLSFPVVDRGVPASRSAASALLHSLDAQLVAGKTLAIHCRQGI